MKSYDNEMLNMWVSSLDWYAAEIPQYQPDTPLYKALTLAYATVLGRIEATFYPLSVISPKP